MLLCCVVLNVFLVMWLGLLLIVSVYSLVGV